MSSTDAIGESSQSDRQEGIGALAAVVIPGGVLALLSTTVVGGTIPDLARTFPDGAENVPWVATVALLASAVAIPLAGWTTARFGVRATWLTAVAILAVGSAGAALAPTVPALIAARAVQGFGGGALEPVMLSALARAAGPARMGRVMGATGAAMSLGPLLGPLGGGIVVQSLGWRWVFGVIAIAALILLVASALVIRDAGHGNPPLDRLGLVLLGVGSTALLAGFSRTATPTGPDGIALAELVIGAITMAGLVRRVARIGERAAVDVTLFRVPGFAPGIAVMALLGAAIYPLLFGLPQFFESAAGLSPVVAGMLLAPYALGQLAAMPATGLLSDRIGPRPLVVAGATTSAASGGAFALLGVGASPWWFAGVGLVLGLGTGAIGGPTVGATYRNLPAPRIPSGSTILFLTNQLGGAFGVALLAGMIRFGGSDGVWTAAAGTVPFLLPTAAAVGIVLIATRLPGRTG